MQIDTICYFGSRPVATLNHWNARLTHGQGPLHLETDAMQATIDSGTRSKYAVCATLKETPEGDFQIVLQDIRSESSNPGEWRHFVFFTDMTFERESALSHSLSDEDYMAVGQAVMARLVALRNLEG